MTRNDLLTPALLVDLDLFEQNVQKMADWAKGCGVKLRPHAKTHKCPEIARRQIAAGAVGVSVATVPEAEAMVAAGLKGVLLTSPIVETTKIERMVNLARHGADILFAVGHKRQVELLEASASRGQQVRLDVLLDLDVSDHRAGIEPGEPALELAKSIVGSNHLKLHGIQAYSGRASHTVGSENRIATSREAMGKALATRDLLAKHGLATTILSGGSTGTYNIDSLIPGVTELQVGSYVFMDLDYRRIGSVGGQEHYLDFQFSLRVLTTVVNVHSDRAIVDAGTKAFATDVPYVPEVLADRGWVYKRMGDEFGMITAEPGVTLPKLGDRIEFIVPHCDPTANLYDRFYALRGDRVEAEWRTTARKLCNSDVSG